MAETHPTCLAYIIYFLRERFYRQAINSTVSFLRTYPNDSVILFFKAFGALNEGHTQEAIRELTQLRDKPQTSLCSVMALLCAHRQSETPDQEAVSELEACLKTSRRTAEDRDLYFAALLYWILGRNEKARDYVERMLKMSTTSSQGLILKGWIFLTSENEAHRSQAIRYFDGGLRDSKDVFGMMGKAEFFMLRQNQSCALDMISQVIASHPNFIPALVLKMNMFMSFHDWEQTAEVAERILETETHNLKALQMMTIISEAKDGDMKKVTEYLQLLLRAIEVLEPSTFSLHVDFTLPISRLCGHNSVVVQMLTAFVQRAVSRAPDNSAMDCELGYLLTLQGKYKEAHRWYTKALNIDQGSMAASIGMIKCQLMDGQVEKASQQLDFFQEVQQSLGRSAEVSLLQAILAQKKGAAEERVVALLKEATELHLQTLRGLPHGVDYLQRLNLNFLLQVVSMHLANSQDIPLEAGQLPPFGLKHSTMILEAVIKAAPGVLISCYYMARVKFLIGDQAAAQHFLNLCMDKEPTMPEIHLLQAKLHVHTGDYRKSLSCLESGVSHNFELRQMPQYNLIKARALKGIGELTKAIQCLRMLTAMPGVRRATEGRETSLSLSERVSVFLELADALRLNGEQHEAANVMQDAIWLFKETPEEMRVMVANVDLALAKDDVDTALNVLRTITPGNSCYIQGKEKMANIYLERMRNKKLYIESYREICQQLPGPHSKILLADAFMKIQEPEKAIEVYQEAVKMAPKDATFVKKICQALVRTYQYDKAVEYYMTALSTSMNDSVYLELAELLFKLQHFEKAQHILEKALEHENNTSLTTMMNDVKLLRILVKVLHAQNEPCLETLQKIYELQQRVVRRLPFEQPEKSDEQRRVTAAICCEQAKEYHYSNDLEKAEQCYSEALNHCPDDTEINFQIAQLYYEHHKLDYCKDQCLKILQHDKKHTATSMLLGDVLFRKNQKEEAISLYTDILHQNPGNFHALARLIHMLHRVGRLDVLPFFVKCESHSPTAVKEPGYHYCKGLYYWHAYRVKEALKHLSQARGDPEWGEETVELMVRICLNPDRETFGGEVFKRPEQDQSSSSPVPSDIDRSELIGVNMAQELLKTFRPRSKASQDKARILYNLCLVHSKEPEQVEKAVLMMSEMAGKNVFLEASLLVAAQGLLQLKQFPRARNFLKRISKVQWTHAIAEDFEKSCLLLADMYITMGRNTNAEKLLNDCIQHNMSCSKAFEYKGYMMENDQRYKDAAELYELAWKYSHCVDPAVGYRLAFNYLRSKNYTLAIDVCHQVLLENPDYPQIRDEILDRALRSLRP
ncbi:tetratricopeptide repeat protein 21A [Astyanax mexicanus]|uniref:Tetratricopeptide repeat protein 21A n=2 Tax=Astyanax mexicanus TaxID=7994 RepID=A0A8T2LXY4_ASTMX|nr:tetratricopeptide repeat protein 21A [Astyanax mexicanus]